MMLASPFLPSSVFSSQHTSDDPLHYRPSKDMDAFNSLLPPPIEFVEGSSSGTLAVVEGKYEAINASPKAPKAELHDVPNYATPVPTRTAPAPARSTAAKSTSLHSAPIDLSWPPSFNRGTGLFNSGNTCFLNSALQCLLHTPPLLKLLNSHKKEDCCVAPGFCMTCSLRQVAVKAHAGSSPFSPSLINNNLQVIAKHMRKGRQEDTHEFLRYAIDALQKSCLAGYPPKLDPKIAETTWVHKLFGGRLRSRVSCKSCGHNSDTFDRILDLSLDIFKCDSLKDALRRFVAVDYLKGADKYKCEKCKKHVNAEKRFTIHEAPPILTIHLKRFSPLGRKLGQPVQYDEKLSLQHCMSEGQFGPTYSLYGVICHAGGGPNSGHYYAFVKSKESRWFEMNDEMVQATSIPTNKKNAYMLFYMQNKGQSLEAAVKTPSVNGLATHVKTGLAAGMKKKIVKPKETTDDEDQGIKVDAPLMGPLLPSVEISRNKENLTNRPPPGTPADPQASALKSKIKSVSKNTDQARKALESLGNYESDSDDEETNKSAAPGAQTLQMDDKMDVDTKDKGKRTSPDLNEDEVPKPSSLSEPTSISDVGPSSSSNPNRSKKRRLSELENRSLGIRPSSAIGARTEGYVGSNPFGKSFGGKRKRMGI